MFKVGQQVILRHLGSRLDTSNRPVFIKTIGPKFITTTENIKVALTKPTPWSLELVA